MKHILTISLFAAAFLVGCGTTDTNSMVSRGSDGTQYYTKHYDYGDWLVQEEIGLIMRAEHSKKVSGTYGLQRSIGALGPDDLTASAILSFWPANYTETEIDLQIHSLVSKYSNEEILNEKKMEFEPYSDERIELGAVDISNYSKELFFSLDYTVNGERTKKEIKLKRLTAEDIQRFNAQGGPDYPWAK